MLRNGLILFILLLPVPAIADSLHLVLNGKSIHTDGNKKWNENNYGLGFEYDFKARGEWIPLVTGSSFKDSNKQTSKYLGGGVKHRLYLGKDKNDWHLDAGVVVFAMTRHDYRNNDPFPGVLPFVSIGTENVALNATYIPSVSPKMVSLFYFQLSFKLADF